MHRTVDFDPLYGIAVVAAGWSPPQRSAIAGEILDLVGKWIPYVGCSISAFDPVTGLHETVASLGYSGTVIDHLDHWFVSHDEAYQHLTEVDPTPRRWRDFPFEYAEMYSARELFIPEGYRDGATICLLAKDGRHTGNLHINADDLAVLSDDVLSKFGHLQYLLGGAVDKLREAQFMIATLDGEVGEAVIILPDQTVVAVPGSRRIHHLRHESHLVEELSSHLDDHELPASFRWRDESRQWHLVTVRRFSTGLIASDSLSVVPHGITLSEMRVLGGLVSGLSNHEIADDLYLSERTVSKHVEHILSKLGCRSRTSAAVSALHLGLRLLQAPK